jgi:hypothetical protein
MPTNLRTFHESEGIGRLERNFVAISGETTSRKISTISVAISIYLLNQDVQQYQVVSTVSAHDRLLQRRRGKETTIKPAYGFFTKSWAKIPKYSVFQKSGWNTGR